MDETAVPAVDVVGNIWFVLRCCTRVLFKVLAGSFARASDVGVGRCTAIGVGLSNRGVVDSIFSAWTGNLSARDLEFMA